MRKTRTAAKPLLLVADSWMMSYGISVTASRKKLLFRYRQAILLRDLTSTPELGSRYMRLNLMTLGGGSERQMKKKEALGERLTHVSEKNTVNQPVVPEHDIKGRLPEGDVKRRYCRCEQERKQVDIIPTGHSARGDQIFLRSCNARDLCIEARDHPLDLLPHLGGQYRPFGFRWPKFIFQAQTPFVLVWLMAPEDSA